MTKRRWWGAAALAAAFAAGFLAAGLFRSRPGGAARAAGLAAARWGPDAGSAVPGPRTAAVPPAYRMLTNPVDPTPEEIDAGRRLYMRYCAFCHGVDGRGHGLAAPALLPRPQDLGGVGARALSDGAFFWRVTDGVRGTAMPAWSAVLAPADRWRILTFIRHEIQRT